MSKKQLGLVLSGGGVKGAAHIGILKVLEDAGVSVSHITGASAGAIVGAFYAAGFKPGEILNALKEEKWLSWSHMTFRKPGFLDSDSYRKSYKKHFGDRQIEDLDKKLFISATDLVEGTERIFSEGPLIDAVLASASFPGVFSPVKIGDAYYADGGTVNNFPVESIEDKCTHILGVYTTYLNKATKKDLDSTMEVLSRCYYIALTHMSRVKFDRCTWIIQPPELNKYHNFKFSKVDEIYEIGVKAGEALIDDIVEKLKDE